MISARPVSSLLSVGLVLVSLSFSALRLRSVPSPLVLLSQV